MGKVRVEKVGGATNIADALTEYHGIDKLDALFRPHGIVNWRFLLGTGPRRGRAKGSVQTLGYDTCGGEGSLGQSTGDGAEEM